MSQPQRVRRRTGRSLLAAALLAMLAFLYAPPAVVVLMSFNESRYGTLPFTFSLQWYGRLAGNQALIDATLLSFALAFAVAATSAVIGTALAVWLVQHGRRWMPLFNGLLVSAITVPWLILGIAMLLVLIAVGIGRSYTGLYVGNLAVTLPYLVLIVVPRLQSLDPAIGDAARSLGATPRVAFWRVTFPGIRSAVLAGTLMAFVVCFNNFPVQYFLAPFGVRTLPLEIYTLVRTGYQPDINALMTVLVVIALGLIGLLHAWGLGAARLFGVGARDAS